MEIKVAGAAPSAMQTAVEDAFRAVAEVHRLMSFHDATSDVGRLNSAARARAVGVHAWTFEVLKTALDLHRRSAGAFEIAVAPILQDMGVLPHSRCASNSKQRGLGRLTTTDAIELLPGRRVRFHHPGLKIDLGGIGKGFAVDRAIDVLRNHGMPGGLVNAGGDLAAFGPAIEKIHIRDPRDPRRTICRIEVGNQALASSGHRFDPFQSAGSSASTIIDPCTRRPVERIAGATVRAPSCVIADALTKVVMVAGASAATLLEHYRAGALMVSVAGDVEMTQDLQSAVCLAA